MEKQQSATFTITADTPQELAALLRRIADALDAGGTGLAESRGDLESSGAHLPAWSAAGSWPSATRSSTPTVLEWWRRRASEFLAGLTPEARSAVFFVARHAPRVPVAELARELEVTPGPQLAGTLASIGYANRRLEAPEPPFRRVRTNYEMDPELAEVFMQLVAHEEASMRPWSALGADAVSREAAPSSEALPAKGTAE